MGVRATRRVRLTCSSNDGTYLNVSDDHEEDPPQDLMVELNGVGTLWATREDLAAFFSACIEAGFLPEAQPAPLLPDDGYPPL